MHLWLILGLLVASVQLGLGFHTVMIVPTGVGASIGGYAGDALPAARMLAEISTRLITHPNVLNGAMLYWPLRNGLYVEGYALDEFAAGRLALQPLDEGGQRIGLLLDKGIEPDLRQRHLQVADGARATLGLDVHACALTPRRIGVELSISQTGASWGSLSDIPALLEGSEELIRRGCTSIAVVARFPEEEDDKASDKLFQSYRQGNGVDAIAGAEALISHAITQRFKVPCAHAPAFDAMEVEYDVSPKAAAEELGYTFLPCVLANLNRAPHLHKIGHGHTDAFKYTLPHGALTAKDVDALVIPADCLGGPAALSLLSRGTLVVAVKDNKTVMKVKADAFPLCKNIIEVDSYLEAAGVIAAKKAGIKVDAVRGKVSPLKIE